MVSQYSNVLSGASQSPPPDNDKDELLSSSPSLEEEDDRKPLHRGCCTNNVGVKGECD